MSWQRSQNTYLETEILSYDPTKLIQVLYDLCIRSVRSAMECIGTKDIPGRTYHVNRAFEVLVELQNSLNFDQGGEIAKNYSRLYDYCQRRLLKGNVAQSSEILAEVASLLSDLQESWQAVVTQCSKSNLIPHELVGHEGELAGAEAHFDCVG